ncbi:LamG domain-containing protein, partial [bacterium]|nr:LamG domain-containing protein [bacterium]
NVKIYSSLEQENKNGFFDLTDGGDSITYYDVIPDLETNEKITVSFWMKWDGLENTMPINFLNYDLYIFSDKFGFNTFASDMWGIGGIQVEDKFLNKWAHVVAVFNNGDAKENILYVNGVEQSLSQITGITGIGSIGNDIKISDSYYFFSGELDNIVVFEGALTPDEVNGLYNLTAFSKKEFDSQNYIQDTVCANCDKLIGLNNEVLLDVNFNNNRKIETISQDSISYNKTLIDNFDGVLGVTETRGRYGNGMNFKNNNIITYKNVSIPQKYTVSYWMKYTDSDYFTHVTKTYNGSSTKYYVNGEFTSSFLLNFPFYQNGTNLDIGWDGTNYFSGVLDHLKIYDYVLNDSEIENLYYDKFYEREGTLEFWVRPDFDINQDSEDNRIIFDYSGALDKNPDVNTFRIYKKYDFVEERQ